MIIALIIGGVVLRALIPGVVRVILNVNLNKLRKKNAV